MWVSFQFLQTSCIVMKVVIKLLSSTKPLPTWAESLLYRFPIRCDVNNFSSRSGILKLLLPRKRLGNGLCNKATHKPRLRGFSTTGRFRKENGKLDTFSWKNNKYPAHQIKLYIILTSDWGLFQACGNLISKCKFTSSMQGQKCNFRYYKKRKKKNYPYLKLPHFNAKNPSTEMSLYRDLAKTKRKEKKCLRDDEERAEGNIFHYHSSLFFSSSSSFSKVLPGLI